MQEGLPGQVARREDGRIFLGPVASLTSMLRFDSSQGVVCAGHSVYDRQGLWDFGRIAWWGSKIAEWAQSGGRVSARGSITHGDPRESRTMGRLRASVQETPWASAQLGRWKDLVRTVAGLPSMLRLDNSKGGVCAIHSIDDQEGFWNFRRICRCRGSKIAESIQARCSASVPSSITCSRGRLESCDPCAT